MLSWSTARARAFLASVHFTPRSIPEYFHHLGSVQYDPLKPVGRNIDLVFQARVPGYRVDDWERWVYGPVGGQAHGADHEAVAARQYYDAWDKQACVVPVEDWPWRRIYHRWHRATWEKRVFRHYGEAAEIVERALAERGPCTGDDLADLTLPGAEDRAARKGSWYGPRLVNHVLKALWFTGSIVTSHRVKGRHVYAPPERVIPEPLLHTPDPPLQENLKWLILRRHQSVGLLRPNAPVDLWSMKITSAQRRGLIAELVEEGRLIEIDVDGRRFHATREQIATHDREGAREGDAAGTAGVAAAPVVRFLAPLDALLWDREAVRYLYDFDYVWEVYKPAADRRYGYYVLPIMCGDRFVGRVDSRLDGGVWRIHRVWWEGESSDSAPAVSTTVMDGVYHAIER
ncbi:MAG: hypothetical protein GVY29_07990, partial [Spirochaetes bacterium]|nr:hypothetical protein [Spirochaetota bacterium]